MKLIGFIIPSTNVSTEFLPLITVTLAYTVYPSELVDDIRYMLRKFKLTEDLIWNMHIHNLKTDQ